METVKADPELILVVDDEPDFLAGVGLTLERFGFRFLRAQDLSQARAILNENHVDLMLIDETLGRESGTRFLAEVRNTQPGLPAILISGHADLEMALAAMHAGAVDILPKPFLGDTLLETVHRNLKNSEILREGSRHRWHASKVAELGSLVGVSSAMKSLVDTVRRVAGTDTTVLIQGESGTGKELVANAIHRASVRRHRELIAENIGSLSQTLLESTLFGVRKGAFTGAATDRAGLFEVADGSTLFLDEIGEASAEVQIRLLRVLEERTVTRVGDSRPKRVDVRVIVATNRDLKEEVEQKRFRADLYYRLNVVRIQVPPLRERLDDLAPIAKYLLGEINRRQKRKILGLDDAAVAKLRGHSWPGNIRELRNVIESAVIHTEGEWITADRIRFDGGNEIADSLWHLPHKEAVARFNKRYFEIAIARAGGNKAEAARVADVDRGTLYEHLGKSVES